MSLISPLLYQSHMNEVKLRLRAIDRILGAKKPRTLNAEFDDEFMWLQLRQIIELVTFSAMLADEERYAALRKGRDGEGAYQHDGRASKILTRLASITPHYLPQALGQAVELPSGVKEFQGSPQKATRDRFVSIHTTASENLHATNPANVEGLFDQASRRLLSRERIRAETAYLKAVLWEHYKVGLEWSDGEVPTDAANPTKVWLVSFGQADALEIRMTLATGKEIQGDE